MNQVVYESALTIAQSLIRQERAKGNEVTPSLIEDKVKLALGVIGDASEIDSREVIDELIRRNSHWIGRDLTLVDNQNHVDWLTADRKKDWRYWHRLRRYMERKLSVDIVDALDESTDGILGLLEDPKREGFWDRRGLVVGHVQSGKTSSYSALICKAADAGYKIIIVLAGMHNNLRSQTQIRLEEAFLGYETSQNREPGAPLGVFEEDSDPSIHPHCATTRADKGDFNASVARHFSISPEERPWLFVVKKNKSVLSKLLKWIQSSHVSDTTDATTGKRIATRLPLLLIDDEADHASVDTGEQVFDVDGRPDENHQPKAINSLIRKILNSFSKSAYVGYTATPFANVFIHRSARTLDEGDDLFPKAFIKTLAAPSNYVGPTRVFGSRSTNGRVGGLPLVREIFDHATPDGLHGWMPVKHDKDHCPMFMGESRIPESLENAVLSFMLICSARALRGQASQHSSMLVHTTRFVAVQNEVCRQITEYVKQVKQRITRGIDDAALLDRLKFLWDSDFLPTSEKIKEDTDEPVLYHSWSEIRAQLALTLPDVVVDRVNGTAKDSLNYEEHKETGLKIIAIGGDKLARGLTLEGLCVSYFVRTTKMYDTLMQMGRWFVYRPGYLDLCRLFTTPDLVEWYGHIADAADELREEFEEMARTSATPEQYGLKVASHPVMLITSPLKMRTAKTLRLSYSGTLVQTVAFSTSNEVLSGNLAAAIGLIHKLPRRFESPVFRSRDGIHDNWSQSFLWTNVPSVDVIAFLSCYQTPVEAGKANSKVITEFIQKMNEIGELKNWSVGLVSEGKDAYDFQFRDDIKISNLPIRTHTGVKGRYSIGVLTDPKDESIDISDVVWSEALKRAIEDWDGGSKTNQKPIRPSGKRIRDGRGGMLGLPQNIENNGLLLIYPLSRKGAKEAGVADSGDPIIGFAISFPSSTNGITAEYKVDHLFWETEYGQAD